MKLLIPFASRPRQALVLLIALVAVLATALAACTAPPPAPTPDIPATVTAQVQAHLDSVPTATPAPTYTPYPTATPYLTPTTAPTATLYPTATPRPTLVALPTHTPYPTATPYPTYTPGPTQTPAHTATPYPTATPRPTYTPYPTSTPLPTANPWMTYLHSEETGINCLNSDDFSMDIPVNWVIQKSGCQEVVFASSYESPKAIFEVEATRYSKYSDNPDTAFRQITTDFSEDYEYLEYGSFAPDEITKVRVATSEKIRHQGDLALRLTLVVTRHGTLNEYTYCDSLRTKIIKLSNDWKKEKLVFEAVASHCQNNSRYNGVLQRAMDSFRLFAH